jgi:hypothetical protein
MGVIKTAACGSANIDLDLDVGNAMLGVRRDANPYVGGVGRRDRETGRKMQRD